MVQANQEATSSGPSTPHDAPLLLGSRTTESPVLRAIQSVQEPGGVFRACAVFTLVILVIAAFAFNLWATESDWIHEVLSSALPPTRSGELQDSLPTPIGSNRGQIGWGVRHDAPWGAPNKRQDIRPGAGRGRREGQVPRQGLVEIQQVLKQMEAMGREGGLAKTNPREQDRFQEILSSLGNSTVEADHEAQQWEQAVSAAVRGMADEDLERSMRMGRQCRSQTDCAYGRNLVCVRARSGSRSTAVGRCECPVMSKGSDTCSKKPSGMPRWCMLHMQDQLLMQVAMLKDKGGERSRRALQKPRMLAAGGLDLPQRADWSTCAVVASSALLAKKSFGAEIDRHTAVIRFNDAPTHGFQKQVGSKTTLRIQNVERCGFAERNELCLQYTQQHGCRNPEFRVRRSSCSWLKPSKRLVDYVLWYWPVSKPPGARRSEMRKLSSGFMGLSLAMHLCGRIDVYGFEGGEGHYFQRKRQARTTFASRHNWQLERQCLDVLRTKKALVTFH